MQGDIFQLDQVQSKRTKDQKRVKFSNKQQENIKPPQNIETSKIFTFRYPYRSEQVAIYNEDDLSHLLYLQPFPLASLNGHEQVSKLNTFALPVAQPLPYPSTITETVPANSPCLSNEDSDSCAVFTDDEGEKDPSTTHHNAHYPIVHHVITSSLHSAPKQSSNIDDIASFIGGGALRHHPAILPTQHSLEALQAVKVDTLRVTDKNQRQVLPAEHVSSIQGPLMSWWPAPMDMLEYDWNEKFYE